MVVSIFDKELQPINLTNAAHADYMKAVCADHQGFEHSNGVGVQVLKSLTAGEAATGGVVTQSQVMVGTLDAELQPLILSKAAQYGLPNAWVDRLAKLDRQRRQVSPRNELQSWAILCTAHTGPQQWVGCHAKSAMLP